jgi:hypothetical protein
MKSACQSSCSFANPWYCITRDLSKHSISSGCASCQSDRSEQMLMRDVAGPGLHLSQSF